MAQIAQLEPISHHHQACKREWRNNGTAEVCLNIGMAVVASRAISYCDDLNLAGFTFGTLSRRSHGRPTFRALLILVHKIECHEPIEASGTKRLVRCCFVYSSFGAPS